MRKLPSSSPTFLNGQIVDNYTMVLSLDGVVRSTMEWSVAAAHKHTGQATGGKGQVQRNDPTTHAGVDLAGEEGTKGGRGKAYVALVTWYVGEPTL